MNTRRLQQVLAGLFLVAAPRLAQAQVPVGSSDLTIGYAGLPIKAPQGANSGVQISDGVLMHAGIGTEVGYDSNVFYAETDPQGSAIVRVVPYIELTNATRSGVAPSGVFFDLNAALVYRRYLNTLDGLNEPAAFMPQLNGVIEFSSNQTLSISLADTFIRLEDPPYNLNDPPIIRNMNMAAAQARWAPGGGRLQALLRYTNTYDDFEGATLNRNDSLTHDLMLDLSWKWLPKTAVFLRASQGYVDYLNESPAGVTPKYNSYPLRLLVGLRGLITRKLSVNVAAGYANAFYQGDRLYSPTTEGPMGSLSATAEVTYRPTVLNTLSLGYRHDFQNSVVGNFYYVDAFYAWFQQQIAGRVAAVLSGRYENRRFRIPGDMATLPSSRTDDFVQVGAAIDYHAAGWFYTGVGYSLLMNDSDAVLDTTPGRAAATFVKHQIFARLGVTY